MSLNAKSETRERYLCERDNLRSNIECKKGEHNILVLEVNLEEEKFICLSVNKVLLKVDQDIDIEEQGDLTVLYDDCQSFGSDQEVKKAFVKHDGFLKRLKEIMREIGFSSKAAESIVPAGWGLQSHNKATYVAKEAAREMLSVVDDF